MVDYGVFFIYIVFVNIVNKIGFYFGGVVFYYEYIEFEEEFYEKVYIDYNCVVIIVNLLVVVFYEDVLVYEIGIVIIFSGVFIVYFGKKIGCFLLDKCVVKELFFENEIWYVLFFDCFVEIIFEYSLLMYLIGGVLLISL